MNHIYKVIFCKATGTFVAVAEFARAHGKKGSGTVGSVSSSESGQGATSTSRYAMGLSGLTTLSAAIFLSLGLSSTAFAAADTCQELNISTGNNIKCGSGAETDSGKSVAIGVNSKATADINNTDTTTGSGNNTAVGYGAYARGGNATALGRDSRALGGQSVAIGVDATATDSQSTAIGMSSKAYSANSTALGRGAEAGVAGVAGGLGTAVDTTAIGSGAKASHANSVALGVNSTTTALSPTNTGNQVDYRIAGRPDAKAITAAGIVSIGNAGSERRIINVAAGRLNANSTDGVNGSQLYHTNELVLGGFQIGQGDNGTKVADISPAERLDFLNGANTTASVTADGTGANVSFNLADKITLTNAGSLTIPSNVTGQNVVLNTNGLNNGGNTITNVASGAISSTSKDAINGSQINTIAQGNKALLGGANSVIDPVTGVVTSTNIGGTGATTIDGAISAANTQANNPLTFTGNVLNDTDNNGSQQKLGSTLNISGGATGASNNTNVKTVVTNGKVDIQLLDAPTFAGQVKANGFDAGSQKITNVAKGTTANDAVNFSQLAETELTSSVKAGNNTTVTGTTTGNNTEYTVDAEKSTISEGTGITVTKGDTTNNTTDYNVKLSDATNTSLGKADSAVQTVSSNDTNLTAVKTGTNVVFDFADAPTFTGQVKVAGFDASNAKITNVAKGTTANDAVNFSQLAETELTSSVKAGNNTTVTSATTGNNTEYTVDAEKSTISEGTGITVTKGATADNTTDYNVKLSDATNTSLGKADTAVQTVTSDNANLTATRSGNDITFDFADAPTFAGQVKAAGFDASNAKIVNVAKGTNPNEAVNFSQLAETELTSSVKAGNNTTVTSATTGNNTEYTVDAEKSTISEGTGITVTKGATADNTTDYNVKLSDATNTSLGKADTAVQTVTSDNANLTATRSGNDITFDFADAPTFAGQVKAAGFDASNAKIVNVAKGTNPNDAVNFSQLAETELTSSVKAGNNTVVTSTTTGNNTEYTVDAEKSTISEGTGITVTKGDTTNNTTDYNVKLSDATNTSLGKADSAVQTVTSNSDNLTATRTGNDITFDFVDAPTFAGQVKAAGFDASNAKIVNVLAGTEGTDAANVAQVKAAKTKVAAGTNVTTVAETTGDDGESVYTVNADKSTVSKGSDAVTVTAGDKDGSNVTDFKIDLSTATKASLGKADSAVQTVTSSNDNLTATRTGNDITFDFADAPIFTGQVKAAGFDAGSQKITNVAKGTEPNDAVNFSQLAETELTSSVKAGNNTVVTNTTTGNNTEYTVDAEKSTISEGTGITVTKGAIADNTTDYNVKLSDATNTSLGKADTAVQTVTSDNANLTATRSGNDITFDFADAPTFTGQVKAAGFDAGSQKITNVAKGTDPNDAVNFSQLAETELTSSVKAGNNTVVTSATTGNNTEYTVDAEKSTISEGTGITVTKGATADNTTDYNVKLSDATNTSLGKADTAVQTVTSDNANLTATRSGNDITFDFADAPTFTGQVKAAGFDASNAKIINVADGIADSDAVNKGQLNALATTGKANTDALGNSTASNLGGGAIYDAATGKVSAPSYSVNNVTKNSVGEAISALDKGFTLQTNGANAVAVKAGDTIDIGTATGENNLEVVKTANTIKYSLKKNLDLGATGSVTTGNTVTNNDGVTINDKAGNITQMTAAGTNVTDGTNTSNYGAAGSTVTDGTNTITTGSEGVTVSNGTDTSNVTADNITVGGAKPVVVDGKDGVITGLTNTTYDETKVVRNRAATEGQVSDVANSLGDLADTPLTFTGNSGSTAQKLGSTLNISGGATAASSNANVKTVVTDGKVDIQLLDAPTFAGQVKANGFDANNQKIVNVKDGTDAKDAVNKGQLDAIVTTGKANTDALGNSTASNLGGGAKYDDKTGTVSSPTYSVNGQNSNNVGDAISELDKGFTLQTNGANAAAVKTGDTIDIGTATGENNLEVVKSANTIKYSLKKNLDLGAEGSLTTGNTITNNAGVTINDKAGNVTKMTAAGTNVTDGTNTSNYGANGLIITDADSATDDVTLTQSGLNNGGNKITNVKAGTAPTDAANIGQVQAAKTKVAAGTNVTTVAETKGDDGESIYTVNADKSTVSKGSDAVTVVAGDKDASNVTDYKVDLSATTKESLGKADSAVQTVTSSNANLTATRVGNDITFDFAEAPTFTGQVKANGFDASDAKVTNVANGTIAVNSKDAVNGGQLFQTADSLKTVLGGNAVNTDGVISTTDIGGTGKNNLNDAIASANTQANSPLTFTGNSGSTAQKLGSTLNISGGATAASSNANVKTVVTNGKVDIQLLDAPTFAGQVKANGFDANNQKIVNVKDGSDAKDAVNKGQLDAIVTTGKANTDALGNSTATNLGGGATYDAATGKVSAPSYSVNNVTKNSVGEAISALDQGFTLQSNDTNAAAVKAGDTIDIGTATGENNLEVVKTDNTIKYSLKKNLDLGETGSVTTGDTVTNNAGVTINDKAGNVTQMTAAGTNVTDGTNTSNYGATGSTITDGAGNATNNTAQGTTVTDGKNTTSYGAAGLTFIDNTTGTALVGTPSITKEGISAGNTVIKNVAAGDVAKDSTDAINGNQLFETNQAIANAQGQANKGFNIAADNGTTDNVQLGETVKYTNKDSNLVATVSDNGINYDLAEEISVKSVTADDGKGNVTKLDSTGTKVKDAAGNNSSYNATGSTIIDTKGNTNASTAAGNTLTDDAGNETITAADGTNVKDANGNESNYGAAGSKITDADGNETITAANGTKVKDANGNESNYGAIGSTITDTAGNTNASTAAGNTLTDNASNKTVVAANGTRVTDGTNTTSYGAEGLIFLNTNGDVLANTPSITKGGINAGNTVIRNVASGLEGKTVEQIKAEGSSSAQWKNSATVGDLTQVQGNVTNVTNNVTNISQALGAKDGLVDDKGNLTAAGEKALITYNVADQAEFVNNSVIGAISKMNEEGIKFIHVNNEIAGSEIPEQANNSVDSSAGGAYSTAIGYQAKVGNQATNGIAIGKGATVTGKDSIAIGTGNVVTGTGSGAIGDPSTVTGDGSYSLGNDNAIATDNSFVIGNNVTKTAENSVNLGSKSAASTEASSSTAGTTVYNQSKINGETYNYAGGTAAGVVSVGDVDAERRIQNVAAGLISKDSTDAINGSQLYGTNQAIEALKTNIGTTTGNVSKGVNFGNGSVANNYQLGDTINVKGDKNVTSTTTTDGVQLGLADNITVKSVAAQTVTADDGKGNSATLTANGTSVKNAAGNTSNYGAAGSTVADKEGNKAITAANGVTVSNAKNGTVYGADGITFVDKNGTAITKAPSVTVQGINAGNQQITNVAEGNIMEGSTDAVNAGQLYNTNQAITKVANSVDDLGYKLDGVQEEANAGISSAMAMASMPQAFLPGKSMISGGIATYNGEGAVAVGMSKLSDNGRWVIKINGSADTKGNAGAAAGVGMHW